MEDTTHAPRPQRQPYLGQRKCTGKREARSSKCGGHWLEVPQARTGPPGQERRGPRKTGLRAVPRFAPGRPSPHRLAISRRGGLRTPTMTALASRRIFPIRAPASRARIRWKWNASARVRPCNADAQSASLRENRPWHHFRAFPARQLSLRLAPPWRGGLCTPARKTQSGPLALPLNHRPLA
jgi:hypothetical protein